MLFNLPNGKTIEISIEHYLSMSDEDIQAFMAEGIGEEIQNPFHKSSLLDEGTVDPIEEVEDIDDSVDYEEDI